MITKLSTFQIVDNTGGLTAQCIGALKSKKFNLKIGNQIIVSIKTVKSKKKIKPHEVKSAIIVSTKKWINRNVEGIQLKFDLNAIVLLNKGDNPLGTRISIIVPKELRRYNHLKIIALSLGLI